MRETIPISIRESVTSALSGQSAVVITGFTPVQGGCINQAGKLHTTAGHYFLKWNRLSGLKEMFQHESTGLTMLRATKAIHVPRAIATKAVDEYQFLLLEYVDQAVPRNDYWELMGRQLAALHRTQGPVYGLNHDNYIGAIPQSNTPHVSWREFFVSQRLTPLLQRAIREKSAPSTWDKQFERLFIKMHSLLPEEAASLVHGDLWHGNILANTLGAPCLIDPAVYYGHREVDLAMMQLFGEPDTRFNNAYHEAYPLISGFDERFRIYNLYPLLVHLLLFGSTYAARIQSTLNLFA